MNIYALCFLVILFFNIFKNRKSLHMLQQNLYNENNRYVKWILKNLKSVFLSIDLLAVITLLIAYVLDNDISKILVTIAIVFYILDIVSNLNNDKEKAKQTKKKLVVTKRVKRLIVTISILLMLPIVIYLLDREQFLLVVFIESIITYLNYVLVLIAKIINTPVEKMVYKYYELKAKDKLKSMSNLKVIGITGSYGKTSSKNILNDILNFKYITKPSPKNLNTEYGLMITINNYIDKFDEVFIAEMGAYKQGEIKKLCNLVHPKYGILTTIGLAHLETFGSPEKIQKTKFELIESLPSDGIAVLNKDDPKQVSYNIKSECKKVWIGIKSKDADVVASDITCDYQGSKFNVTFKGDSTKYPFETKLLGDYNIYNILAGIALGREFGISVQDLQQAVKKVRAVEARLELKDFGYMYQINDAYNSNPIGAKMALDVLNTMPGHKVVVTPGMVELGEKEKELNHIFGTQIAKVADTVILVGAKRTRPIFDGLRQSGYNKDKLYVVNNVYEAYNLLQSMQTKEKVYALFENDLPDTYNE